ncbi:MAG: heme o synthase [Rhodothermales bacterium]
MTFAGWLSIPIESTFRHNPNSEFNVAHAQGISNPITTPQSDVAAVPVWRDYLTLTKPEITFLVAISALAGFLLGSPGALDGWTLTWLLIGVTLSSAGAGALNHCIEAERDALMKRTMNRPIPSGRIPIAHARLYGFALICAGVGLVCPLTNPLTGVLAGATVALYLYVYTPLKRKTTYNTLIGTLPGALPALGGWTAATGSLGWGGFAIFGILAMWQLPHFYAIAWMYRKDYARGGHAMLTVNDPEGHKTAHQILWTTVLLVVLSVTPLMLGLTTWLYGAGALVLGVWFLYAAIGFFRERTAAVAKRVLKVSIGYVQVIVLLLILDRFV